MMFSSLKKNNHLCLLGKNIYTRLVLMYHNLFNQSYYLPLKLKLFLCTLLHLTSNVRYELVLTKTDSG